ncbi:hypothetical protein SAY87_019195 [Trapa incisa]|uniref:Uncharacterized protein n=1 Tax=Trapa incisa TaxID=236973 RepID=A0AAN7Q2G2_9MYRT|nr:hypothetical protein SAY87_019195 [Trapa incisa]
MLDQMSNRALKYRRTLFLGKDIYLPLSQSHLYIYQLPPSFKTTSSHRHHIQSFQHSSSLSSLLKLQFRTSASVTYPPRRAPPATPAKAPPKSLSMILSTRASRGSEIPPTSSRRP